MRSAPQFALALAGVAQIILKTQTDSNSMEESTRHFVMGCRVGAQILATILADYDIMKESPRED